MAIQWLRQLVTASPHGGLGSHWGQSMWDLWWTEIALGQAFLGVLWFSPVNIFPLWLSIFIYYLRDEQ
jgi:hypothetical protein